MCRCPLACPPKRPYVRPGAQRDSGVALAPRGRDPRSGTRRGRGAARAAAAVAGRAVRDAHAAAHAAQPPRLAVHPTEPPPPPSSKPRPFPPPPPPPPSPPSLSHAPPHRALPLRSDASRYVATLLASLQWVHMLLQKSGPRVMQLSQQARPPIDLPSISHRSHRPPSTPQIWPALFKCLSNTSEEVVRLDIEALARCDLPASRPHPKRVSPATRAHPPALQDGADGGALWPAGRAPAAPLP